MRLIDADALIDSLNIRSVTYNCIINKCIEDAPTIDAVEVVRCKDCKWHLNGHLCKQLSQYGSIETPSGFYCGFGERR